MNEDVGEAPELINSGPYEEGWLAEITIEGGLDPEGLLDAAGYRGLTE